MTILQRETPANNAGRLGCLLAGLLLSVACLAAETNAGSDKLPSFERVRALSGARSISDPLLTDHRGQPFRLSSLRGRVTLVFFGFTHCPDVCPLAMEKMRILVESGRLAAEDMAYVLISVDGARDTPAVLREYLKGYSPEFIGLTAAPGIVQNLASDFSVKFFRENPDAAGNYQVAHSPQTFVLDTQGRLRAELYSASLDAMAGISQALLEQR
jgi:protein SCO1/2